MGESMPRVAVVLLNWNDREQAEHCLDAVLASEGVEADVLVVDNGSSGDDVPRLTARLGPDRVLALPDNVGYAGGMNAGLGFWRERGGGEPVLILTPDATVAPGTLRRLVDELAADDRAGVVGPLVVHSREGAGLVSAGGAIDVRRVRTRPFPAARDSGPFDADWIDGCCMLVRRDAVEQLSFDERFFIYFEETDFCHRARQAGWRVRVVPDAVVEHPKSPGTLPPYYFYYMVRNRYLFWQKNFGVGAGRVAAVVAWLTLRGWAAAARSLVARRDDGRARLRDARLQLRAAWAGTGDHLRGRYGRMPAARMPPAGA
jgi:GT2 family glycosyltransferase